MQEDHIPVERTIGQSVLESGEQTTVSVEFETQTAIDFVALEERFSPAFDEAELDWAQSDEREWKTVARPESLTVFYDAKDAPEIEPGTTVEIGYKLTAPPGPGQYGIEGYLGLTGAEDTEEQTLQQISRDAVHVGEGLGRYAGADGVIDTDGLRDAIGGWRAGEIGTPLLRDVIAAWRAGDPVR